MTISAAEIDTKPLERELEGLPETKKWLQDNFDRIKEILMALEAAIPVDWDTVADKNGGDLPYWNNSGVAARLAKGAALQQLRMNSAGQIPEWFSPAALEWLNVAAETAGDLPLFGTSGAPALLNAGSSGQILTMDSSGAFPEWQTPSNTWIDNGLQEIPTSVTEFELVTGLPDEVEEFDLMFNHITSSSGGDQYRIVLKYASEGSYTPTGYLGNIAILGSSYSQSTLNSGIPLGPAIGVAPDYLTGRIFGRRVLSGSLRQWYFFGSSEGPAASYNVVHARRLQFDRVDAIKLDNVGNETIDGSVHLRYRVSA